MCAIKHVSNIFHTTAILCFGYALVYDLFHVYLPAYDPEETFPGRWKFLSVWNVVLQLVFHSVALLNDLFGTNETASNRTSLLQCVRDWLFASWAFPIGLFVSVTYWALIAYDPSLVFPIDGKPFFPPWLNQIVHTGPAVFVLLELFFIPKSETESVCSVFRPCTNLGYTVTYLAWITWVHSQNGVWAYPILDGLNVFLQAAFFVACGLTLLGLYFLGAIIAKCRWGKGSFQTAQS
ncbi:Androgen-induced protein [Orchesella cincta]|uniref:Androgen-induced protein n=1 Tax=Orchesella cincta TaxID=48709 RepID=A0A1D2MUJ9_ORCCI|nr:Androgen-induced protein [Orchesella cincta]